MGLEFELMVVVAIHIFIFFGIKKIFNSFSIRLLGFNFLSSQTCLCEHN